MWTTLGFDATKKFFERMLREDSMSHSYLFTGPDMIGKRTFALELAGKLAHTSDILCVATNDIDAVREAKRFLSLSALNGKHKVVIIDNAGHLTEGAQNALLKVLEESSPSSILILVAQQAGTLLPTIVSRAQDIAFPPHPRTVYDEFFADKQFSQSQQDFLYEFSNGSIGMLYRYPDYKMIKEFAEEFTALSKADLNGRFTIAQKLATDETLPQKILFWMLYLRTKRLYKPLRGLLRLSDTITQPQFNLQLALEQYMVEL